MKSLMCAVLTGVLLGTVLVDRADAGDGRKGARNHRAVVRHERRVDVRHDRRVAVRHDRYFGGRDVYVIREYYRPHYRPLRPGPRQVYYRNAYLPYGWATRIRPVPVYVERELIPIPHGYRRGIIDGQVVVHNDRGLILDVAVLF